MSMHHNLVNEFNNTNKHMTATDLEHFVEIKSYRFRGILCQYFKILLVILSIIFEYNYFS